MSYKTIPTIKYPYLSPRMTKDQKSETDINLSFESMKLDRALVNAIEDLGYDRPTPIQAETYSIIRSGRDVVGISQTGTGKTTAYMLPILRDLPFSKQVNPRVLVLVPTRELVVQQVEQIKELAKYKTLRILGVYGGTNINTQAQYVAQGVDILVATPGRLYDLSLNANLKLKAIQKLVIDEVDVMLDLGFRFQLNNILDLLPERRQDTMFSATMTKEVGELIDDHFNNPAQISIASSGTPLENISQLCYAAPNFYTKVELLKHLLTDKEKLRKVIVFMSSKKQADLLLECLSGAFDSRMGIIHANRSQNARLRAIEEFESGEINILIATDVIARGLDLDRVSHVISYDCPQYPENYMHRIGRTGRAEEKGSSILFYTEQETERKEAIEALMDLSIPEAKIPDEVDVKNQLLPSEREERGMEKHHERNKKRLVARGESTHQKKDKNKKVNLGGAYRRELAKKYKKSQTRGDKKANLRSKKKKK